jgi:hypothetical protein
VSATRAQGGARIEVAHDSAKSRIVASGELDLACVAALNRAMSAATARQVPIDLDLSEVTFLDSRFSAAVGAWERDLGPDRLRIAVPAHRRAEQILALRFRLPAVLRRPPAER